jgi:uncharacterized membrane protein
MLRIHPKNIAKMKLLMLLFEFSKPFARNERHKWISASMLFSVFLVVVRIFYTGQLTFIFLLWNLFLAFIPFSISCFLQRHSVWVNHRLLLSFGIAAWILFIPNSFYIITDLFHLGISSAPIWYDLALLLSFAWNGLILGIISVRQIEKIFHSVLPQLHEMFFLLPVMFINAFGIYVGRYLRFNSWDVIGNPFELIGNISALLLYPTDYKSAWAMISCYAALLTFIYVSMKRMNNLMK